MNINRRNFSTHTLVFLFGIAATVGLNALANTEELTLADVAVSIVRAENDPDLSRVPDWEATLRRDVEDAIAGWGAVWINGNKLFATVDGTCQMSDISAIVFGDGWALTPCY